MAPLIVDIHTHFVPPMLLEAVESGEGPPGLSVGKDGSDRSWRNRELEYPLDERLFDVPARLRNLDEVGIDAAVLSVAPDLFFYDAEPAQTASVCRMANDDLIRATESGDGRLFGLASVPLNDPPAAVDELRRVADAPGIVGAAIGTSVNALMLDDESLDPFYAVLSELRMPLLVHPHLEELDRSNLVAAGLEPYYLYNTIGNPLETVRAAGHLILGGVLDRHPDLTVQLVHGGGHFVFQLGRMDHAFAAVDSAAGRASAPPSHYLDRFLFDTVVFEPLALEFLVRTVGADRVTFGTDLPFAMADTAALAVQHDWRDAVLGGNAVRAYGLQSANG